MAWAEMVEAPVASNPTCFNVLGNLSIPFLQRNRKFCPRGSVLLVKPSGGLYACLLLGKPGRLCSISRFLHPTDLSSSTITMFVGFYDTFFTSTPRTVTQGTV